MGPENAIPRRMDMRPETEVPQKGHGIGMWGVPRKDLGPESGKRTGNLTGVPTGGEQTENIALPNPRDVAGK